MIWHLYFVLRICCKCQHISNVCITIAHLQKIFYLTLHSFFIYIDNPCKGKGKYQNPNEPDGGILFRQMTNVMPAIREAPLIILFPFPPCQRLQIEPFKAPQTELAVSSLSHSAWVVSLKLTRTGIPPP